MPGPLIHRHLTRIELGTPHKFHLAAPGLADPPILVKLEHVRGGAPGSKDVEWSASSVRMSGEFLEVTSTPTEVRPPTGIFAPFGGPGDGLVVFTIIHPPESPGGLPRPEAEPPVIPVYYHS